MGSSRRNNTASNRVPSRTTLLSRLTIADWSRQLISRVLQISHAQWVFWNVLLHDACQGYIKVKTRAAVLQEVDRLVEVDPVLLPDSRKYLLEIDFSSLHRDTLEKQFYWLLAMTTAMKAGQRTVARSRHSTARQRRASAMASSPRQVNGATGPRMMAAASMTTGRSVRPGRLGGGRATRELRRRQGYTVAGAAETIRQIRDDFSGGVSPSRKRPSPSTRFLERRDVKRWRPD